MIPNIHPLTTNCEQPSLGGELPPFIVNQPVAGTRLARNRLDTVMNRGKPLPYKTGPRPMAPRVCDGFEVTPQPYIIDLTVCSTVSFMPLVRCGFNCLFTVMFSAGSRY